MQIYLNVAGRDPVNVAPAAPFQQVPAADVGATVAADQGRLPGARSTRTTGPTTASPRAGRSSTATFTKAEARYIPNGPSTTADMAHPTRTGDLVVFSYPPYQFDAETPGTLIAPVAVLRPARLRAGRAGPRRDNVNMRATFLAGGPGIAKGTVTRADDRPRADARLPARHPRAAAEPGPGAARRAQGRQLGQADLDRRAQRLPRPARPDDARVRQRHQRPRRRRRSARDDVRRGARAPARPGAAAGRRRQRRRLAAELGAARGHADDRRRERLGPRRHVATATTSSTTASTGSIQQQARANFPFLATNIVETATGQAARLGRRRRSCSTSTASRSASSAPSCRTRPSSSPPAPPPA